MASCPGQVSSQGGRVERESLFGGCDSTLHAYSCAGLVYELNRLLYGAAGKETHRVMFLIHTQALPEDLLVRTAAQFEPNEL